MIDSTTMPEKLTELHFYIKEAEKSGLLIRTLSFNPRIQELASQILTDFGLPVNAGYEEILVKFGTTELLTEELINETLIQLADAAANHWTNVKLYE